MIGAPALSRQDDWDDYDGYAPPRPVLKVVPPLPLEEKETSLPRVDYAVGYGIAEAERGRELSILREEILLRARLSTSGQEARRDPTVLTPRDMAVLRQEWVSNSGPQVPLPGGLMGEIPSYPVAWQEFDVE